MYSQVEVRKFILGKWLRKCNVPINSLAKTYKVRRKTVSHITKLWSEGHRLESK